MSKLNLIIYVLLASIILLVCSFFIQDFRIDASSDTLVAQNDSDFRYFNKYNKIFKSDNFLVLAVEKKGQIDKKFIPKLTFYFKIDKKTLLKRKKQRGISNKFDEKYMGEFNRIQKNYNEISKIKIYKRNFITIDASKTKENIHQEIIKNIIKWKLIK